tara:strand:- start:36 stop:251 length:216 start_codon:yes stop_codon:yes gene_type:complete
MVKVTNGICVGLVMPYSGIRECVAGPLYYPDDIDENDNILPVVLENGLCVACIEEKNDNYEFELANAPDFA